MKTEIKEFIKEQHAEACGEWKVKIEEKFPEVFKSELKMNTWYKYSDGTLVFYKGDTGNLVTYGFTRCGRWIEDRTMGVQIDLIKPATEAEVVSAFEKEFEKLGFKKGVKFNALNQKGILTLEFKGLDFDQFFNDELIKIDGQCIYSNNFLIYKDGVFATIVEEEKPEQSEWTISDKELKDVNGGFSISIKPLNDEEKTITILGNGMAKTISVPVNSEITINLNQLK